MTKNQRINRRDFIKLSALAGMALPAATVVGSVGGMEIIESPDEYGGFYVRRHKLGKPPYTVDDKVWKRPDFVENVTKMFDIQLFMRIVGLIIIIDGFGNVVLHHFWKYKSEYRWHNLLQLGRLAWGVMGIIVFLGFAILFR